MPELSITNFSCIKKARLELKQVTVLIGPQASGKSVISKLFYFFSDIFDLFYENAEEENNLRNFQRNITKKFSLWFPPSAWGRGDFLVEYTAGPIKISISKKKSRRSDVSEATITTSQFFNDHYEEIFHNYRKALKQTSSDDEYAYRSFQTTWPIRRDATKKLRAILRQDYISSQFFIPAGRSFFTNLGKAVAIFEHGGQLDDVTKQFGRLFASLIDGRYRPYLGEKPSQRIKDFIAKQKLSIQEMFGGEIKLSSNDTHVSTLDGRKIPLSTLSSGQQELLPLILILQFFTTNVAQKSEPGVDILYVEEPEAHLFPSAQEHLTRHLVEISNFSRGGSRLLITTHSPYVLSTLNNLIKASRVAKISQLKLEAVSNIVSRESWLEPSHLSAYAIQNRELVSIVDEESGLINADYLDEISSQISEAFMNLLDIEADVD